MTNQKRGLLLIHTGAIEQLTINAVKSYLHDLYSDPYVLSWPSWLKKIWIDKVILPLRTEVTLEKYKKIWLGQGLPARLHAQVLQKKLNILLKDDFKVLEAFRFGSPSIKNALDQFYTSGVREVFVIPLYPQWAQNTTESAIFKVNLENEHYKLQLDFFHSFFEDIHYYKVQETLIVDSIHHFAPDFVLFSFNGAPEKPISKRYFEECKGSATLLAQALENIPWKISYQTKNLIQNAKHPSTLKMVRKIAKMGYKRLLVVNPSSVFDSPENLIDLGQEACNLFKKQSGGQCHLVPALNSSDSWAQTIAFWAKNKYKLTH